jgi:putative transposase
MSELLPIPDPPSVPQCPSASVPSTTWLSVTAAAVLMNISERRIQQLCGEDWLAQGKARTVRQEGLKPAWEVRSDADPALGSPISRLASPSIVTRSLKLSPALLVKATQRLAILQRWDHSLTIGREMNWSIDESTDHFLAILAKESAQAIAAETPNTLGKIKRSTLYVWRANYKSDGLAGLVDARSERRESGLSAKHADPFLTYVRHLFEHENRRSMRWCHDHAILKAKESHWTPSSYVVTKRYLRALPKAELILRRDGPKSFNDQCVPNIKRVYADLKSNEVWVSDHHQLDVLVKIDERLNAGTGEMEPVYGRPWLTVWMDCRSRKIVAWTIRVEDPATDVIIATWRRGVKEWGVPEVAFTDNGADYLAQVFTGESKKARQKRLFSKRKIHVEHDQVKLGGIFAACHVQEHWRAWPFHGQSKPVERFFRTVCLRFSVEFETYCGSSPDTKPAGLYAHMGESGRLERGLAPELSEFIDAFGDWLECDYHQHYHRGDGMEEFIGPDDAYAKCLVTKQTMDPQTLDVVCQPAIGPLPVTQDGVTHQGITYGRGQLMNHFGRKVRIRLGNTVNSVSVWSLDDKEFLGIADANEGVPFRATEVEKKAAIQEKRRDTRKLKESFEPALRIHETVTERMARRRREAAAQPSPQMPTDPYVIKPLRSELEGQMKTLQSAEENREYRQTVGAEFTPSLSLDDALSTFGGDQ